MPDKYLDSSGLARYDEKIKSYIAGELSPIEQALDDKIDTSGGTTVQSDFSLVHEQSTGKTSWFELSEVDKGQVYYPSVALGTTSTSHNISTVTKMEVTSGEIKFVYKRQSYTCTVKVPLSLENKTVTLATTEDVRRVYAHDITLDDGGYRKMYLRCYTTSATPVTTLTNLLIALVGTGTYFSGTRYVGIPAIIVDNDRRRFALTGFAIYWDSSNYVYIDWNVYKSPNNYNTGTGIFGGTDGKAIFGSGYISVYANAFSSYPVADTVMEV